MTESLCSRGSTASLRGRDVLSRSLSFTPFPPLCPMPAFILPSFQTRFCAYFPLPPFLITTRIGREIDVPVKSSYISISSKNRSAEKLRPNSRRPMTSREGRLGRKDDEPSLRNTSKRSPPPRLVFVGWTLEAGSSTRG